MVSRDSPSSTDRVTALLVRLPFFAQLPPHALDDLVQRIRVRRFDRGTAIFHKDDPGSLLYIILSGAVKITTSSSDGKEMMLCILGAGDFFGELSLFDEEPRSATAEAVEDETQTLILPRDDFLKLVGSYPQLAIHIITLLSRRLRETDLLVQDVCLLDLPGRLAGRLLDLAERHGKREGEVIQINLRLTQSELAALVGATRVATNRQLQRMQQRGLIEWEARQIRILKPEALRRLALL